MKKCETIIVGDVLEILPLQFREQKFIGILKTMDASVGSIITKDGIKSICDLKDLEGLLESALVYFNEIDGFSELVVDNGVLFQHKILNPTTSSAVTFLDGNMYNFTRKNLTTEYRSKSSDTSSVGTDIIESIATALDISTKHSEKFNDTAILAYMTLVGVQNPCDN